MMKEKFDYNVHKIGGAGLMQSRSDLIWLTGKAIKEAEGGVTIFVVSALAGVTRLLGSIFQAIEYKQTKEVSEFISKFKKIHLDATKRLVLKDSEYFKEKSLDLINELEAFAYDGCLLSIKDHSRILTLGERYSSLIFGQFLNEINQGGVSLLDARSFIFGSGNDYLNSEPMIPETINEIIYHFKNENSKIVVTQGYIANDNRVLGYDGSDLTAAIIALAMLQFREKVSLTYWKDVPGVMRNPNNMEEGVFSEMYVTDYLEFSNRESVPVRSDAIGLFVFSRSGNLQISINSFKDLERVGTIIKP